jgi:hypothetical protein
MNTAQRLVLKIMLAIDALLILFPPFQLGGGWHIRYLGHHWLLYAAFNNARVDFGTLAAEITIVSIVGLTVFIFANGIPDERVTTVTDRLSAFRRVLWKRHSRHPRAPPETPSAEKMQETEWQNVFAEAYERDLLPPDIRAGHEEAVRRGLVPGASQVPPQSREGS